MPVTNTNQWAIREVAIATFYDIATGKALLQLDDLKTSGLENAATTVYAKGGRGNANIVGFSADRTVKLTLEDAVFTNQALAMMTGNNLITGAQNIYKREILTVATNAATVSKTPVGAMVGVYKMNPDGSHGSEFTATSGTVATGQHKLTTKTLSFFAGDLTDGDKVVVYYMVATDASSQKITVSADKFAGSFKLVLDCLVRDTFTKQDFAAQIVVPNCKMEDNWKISMAADGEPSTFSIPMEALKPAVGTDMWTMTIYNEAGLV